MKHLFAALALLFAPSLALAQGVPLFQSGAVTPNHLLKSSGNGLQMDAGGLTGDNNGRGLSPFSITDNLGLGLCSHSAVTGGAHYQFCLGHDSSGNALLSATANGGAVEKSIYLRKNGTDYEIPFVGAGGGNVVGPVSTTTDHVAVWNNSAGTLLKDVTSLGLTGLNVTGAPAALTITPTNQLSSALTYNSTASGTVTTTPTDTNLMSMWWLRHQGALIGNGVNRAIGLFEANYNDTGTVTNDDSFVGVTGNCNLLGAKVNTGSARLAAACVGVVAAARGIAHQGGLPGTEAGEIHALNVVAGLSNLSGSLPHDYYDVIGAEVNVTGCTGCTTLIRIGFNSIDFGNGGSGDSEQGLGIDAAYAIASVGGTKGWRYGIDFTGTPVYGGNPIDPVNGIVLGSTAGAIVTGKSGIDLNNFAFTDFAFRGPSGLSGIDGLGNIAGQTITAQANFIANNPSAESALIQFQDTGVAAWNVGRVATTDNFVIVNVGSGITNLSITPAGVVSLGNTNAVSIAATGGVIIPGVATSGTIAGAVCMAADKTLIYKVGAGACI